MKVSMVRSLNLTERPFWTRAGWRLSGKGCAERSPVCQRLRWRSGDDRRRREHRGRREVRRPGRV